MNIRPIRKVGASRRGTLKATYGKIVDTLGFEPNVTHLDDPHKVDASWAFASGRWQGFIWRYKQDAGDCTSWSIDGDRVLLDTLFGADNIT